MRRNPSERLDERQSRSHRATGAGEPRGSRRSPAVSERRTRWHDTSAPWTPRAVAAEAAEARSAALPRDAFAAENVRCAEDARVNIGAGLFGDGDVPAPPWTSRPWIDAIDPRGAASGHARPSLGARRSTRPAVRVSGVRTRTRFLPAAVATSLFCQRRCRSPKTYRASVAGVGAKLGETNERARFVEGSQAGPRAAHEARAARTRPPVLFVSITGTFSGSSGERYVPSLPMRPIEPPIPVRRLPSLPRCASGEIDPVSCSRSRRDRVADPARRALRRAAHVTLIWRQDRFPPAKDALRDPLTSSPPRAFPATSRTT